jgi:hypothetical protein
MEHFLSSLFVCWFELAIRHHQGSRTIMLSAIEGWEVGTYLGAKLHS